MKIESIKLSLKEKADFLKVFFKEKFLPILSKILKPKYLIFVGIVFVAAGIFIQELFIPGIVILFGMMANISARKRKGVFSKKFLVRHIIEFLFVFIYFAAILLQKDIVILAFSNPLTNILLPILFLSFFFFPTMEKYFKNEPKKIKIAKLTTVLILLVAGFSLAYCFYPKETGIKDNFIENGERGDGTKVEWKKFDFAFGASAFLPGEPTRDEKKYKIGLDSELTYDQDLYVLQTEKTIFSLEKLVFPSNSNLSKPDDIMKALVAVNAQKIIDSKVEKVEFTKYRGDNATDFLITKGGLNIKGRLFFKDGNIYRATTFYENSDLSSQDYLKFVDSIEIK